MQLQRNIWGQFVVNKTPAIGGDQETTAMESEWMCGVCHYCGEHCDHTNICSIVVLVIDMW